MTQTERPRLPIRPKRPSPMMAAELPLSLKEAIKIVMPRWLKRSSRRDPSS